jgi:hypothetical protein
VDETMSAGIPESGDCPRKHHHESRLLVFIGLVREIVEFEDWIFRLKACCIKGMHATKL